MTGVHIEVHDNRRRWIEALLDEKNKDRQIRGQYRDAHGGICALGLGADVCLTSTRFVTTQEILLVDLGLGPNLQQRISHWNDEVGLSFHEIGKRLKDELL